MSAKHIVEKVFRAVVAAGLFFCFFVLPFLLGEFGFSRFFSEKEAKQKKQAFEALNNRLDLLLQYKNGRHYYHVLLNKIFELANSSADPLKYLSKALNNLKKQNPNVFRFAVWGKNGQLVKSLTDETGYSYAMKTLYKAFVEADASIKQSYPGRPEELDFINNKLSILKGYLGDFLMPSELNLPYLQLNLGEIITSSSNWSRAHFWYKVGRDYVLFAQISELALTSANYLKKLVRGMNKSGGIITGIAEVAAKNYVYTGINSLDNGKLLTELKNIQNFSDSRIETEEHLILGRIASKGLLAFCLMPKKGVVINAADCLQKAQIGMLVFLSLLFLALLYFYRYTKLFSIRFKLSVLFIYANALPLAILGAIGLEYLGQIRLQMSLEYQEEISDFLAVFEAEYLSYISAMSDKFNAEVDKINQKYKGKYVNLEDEGEFTASFLKTRPAFALAYGGKRQISPLSKSKIKISRLLLNTLENILKYLNVRDYPLDDAFCNPQSNEGANSIKDFLNNKKIPVQRVLKRFYNITPEQMGFEKQLYYWNLFGDYDSGRFSQIFLAAYGTSEFQDTYVKKYITRSNRNASGIKCVCSIMKTGMLYPEGVKLPPQALRLLEQLKNSRVVKDNSVFIDETEYIAYGTIGKSLDEAALIGFKSAEKINARIKNLKIIFVCFAVISLATTLTIGRLLAAKFLKPIKEIENGVKAIGSRDFKYRLGSVSENEFGQLANAFNRAISGLEDMSLAQVVQENLFPAGPLIKNNLEILGKSVAMNTLGGDYYDYFELDEGKAGILIGDVAGHGVPASLLMAMAKASVLLAENEKKSPQALLTRLHDVIYKVKSQSVKRMMTCQYFCIDSLTGECAFTNAGHPYPAVVRQNGAYAEFLEIDGTPLGITKKARHKSMNFKLQENDIMVLYTDGIAEAKNANGEMFGFARLKQAIKEAYSKNLEQYYAALYKTYKSWCTCVDDDLTIVLVKLSSARGRA